MTVRPYWGGGHDTTNRMEIALDTPPMTLDDIAAFLVCSRRHVERERSAGRLPTPDFHIGKRPRWWKRTILAWLHDDDA